MNAVEIRTLLALQEENLRLKSPHEPGILWEVDVLAHRWGVSCAQIRRWIKDGKLAAFQLAGNPEPRFTRITELEREIFEEASMESSGGES